jgi:hypothetical protein
VYGLFYDTQGKERPFFLMNGQFLSTIKNFASFESFMGNGGQMQSFEAAYGIIDKKSGKPLELFNRQTGVINSRVVKTWKPYDLGGVLVKNYTKMAPQLDNKIFLYAGADDNFFLNRSVEIFRQKAVKLHAKVTVELIPGANHWSIWSQDFTRRMHKDMDEKIN